MEHITLSSRTASDVIKAASILMDAIQEANNELQEELMRLQLTHAGIEETDWMRHPENLERDIAEYQEATQTTFEVAKQVERLAQLTAVWRDHFDADLPSES